MSPPSRACTDHAAYRIPKILDHLACLSFYPTHLIFPPFASSSSRSAHLFDGSEVYGLPPLSLRPFRGSRLTVSPFFAEHPSPPSADEAARTSPSGRRSLFYRLSRLPLPPDVQLDKAAFLFLFLPIFKGRCAPFSRRPRLFASGKYLLPFLALHEPPPRCA